MVSQGDCENFHNILGIMNFMTEARFIKQKSVDMCTCVYTQTSMLTLTCKHTYK